MLLKLFIANNELREKYLDAVVEHNNKLDSEQYPNSGFDLYLPEDTKFRFGETQHGPRRKMCSMLVRRGQLYCNQQHSVYLLVLA